MLKLTDKQIAEYLYRSYTSVDGLWFMKLEEKYGFDTTLDIDNEVWKILPKIQARMLKPLVNTESPVAALRECLTTRMRLDGFRFRVGETDDAGFELLIETCPWRDLLVKSGRESFCERIGTAICNTVHSTWAAEFDSGLSFNLPARISRGDPACRFVFAKDKT